MPSDQWDGSDRRNEQQWRIKKEISLGDLIAFTTAAFAVVYAYFTLDTRVKLVEQTLVVVSTDQRRQDDERTQIRQEVKIELRELNNKIDRILFKDRPH